MAKSKSSEVYVKLTNLFNLETLVLQEIYHHPILNNLSEKEMEQLLLDIDDVIMLKAIFTGREI